MVDVDSLGYAKVLTKSGSVYSPSTAYHATALNAAFSGLKAGRKYKEEIQIQGEYNIDDTVKVAGYAKYSAYGAKFTAVNALNKNMFEHLDAASFDVDYLWQGGNFRGNKANQASGDIFHLVNATSPPADERKWVHWKDINYEDSKDIGFFFDGSTEGGHLILNHDLAIPGTTALGGCEEQGLWIKNVYDGYISSCRIDGAMGGAATHAAYFEDCGPIQVNSFYSGAGMIVHGCNSIMFTNLWTDHNGTQHNVRVQGGINCQFVTVISHQIEADNNRHTKSGMYFENDGGTHSTDNQVAGMRAGRSLPTGTDQLLYAIEEADANQDHNTYTNINGRDCYTAAIKALGVNDIIRAIKGTVLIA